ncbi:MAG TPA: ATP-binding protein, partial [Methylocystis sp.]|nr:ATP-binding protein [Methylocystis sp.]
MERALRRDEDRVVVAVLRGPPGYGKSSLASAYAERARADYRAIWSLCAESESSLRADLVDFALEMGGLAPGAPEERMVESALRFISNAGADHLFIFDDADKSDVIERYWPQSGAARVLAITSLDSGPRRGELIEVPPWQSDAGADFLLAYTGSLKERREAEALSEALRGLPLALGLAAAYCAQTGMGFAQYRNRLEAGTADAGEQEDVVARAYALSIDAAKERHPAAGMLMESAALLGPGPLPLAFFYE